jgi:tRNA pseudouridine38-40 synthase
MVFLDGFTLLSNSIPMDDRDHRLTALQNWRVTLSYDGTDYRGWQVQPGEPTIQGELQAALGRVTGESPLPQGSGRTDAGVHALAQVASFALQARIPPENLQRALNRALPDAIRVLDARFAPHGFHARHSAAAKTYEYRVFLERPETPQGNRATDAVCPPFLARYVYACPWPLNLDALNDSARLFDGEHDFTSFAAVDPDRASRAKDGEDDPATAIRTIFASAWERRVVEDGMLLVYCVRGNGFLHHMVRNLVGTMIDVGRGYRKPEEVPEILAARSRSAAGPTAPAKGLFLHSVEYGEEQAANERRLIPD